MGLRIFSRALFIGTFLLLTNCSPVNPLGEQPPQLSPTGFAVQTAPPAVPATTLPPQQIEATPTSTIQPAFSPTPTSEVELRQLTTGGCCTQPFWSSDSQWVLFVDKPAPDAPAGLWRVSIEGGVPEYFTDRLGIFSPDFRLRAYPEKGKTFVERLEDSQRWLIPNDGRVVLFSPDGERIAWTAGQSSPPFDMDRREIWVSRMDGSQARRIYIQIGGGVQAWFPDGRLLISGRVDAPETGQALWALALPEQDGEESTLSRIAAGERLRNISLSPDGTWLAFITTYSLDIELDGLWVVNTTTGASRRLETFGAFQWRDSAHLLVIPLDLSQSEHQLWQYEIETGVLRPLSDPQNTPIKVANGDWRVSPDGKYVVFVSARDHNLWLFNLPED